MGFELEDEIADVDSKQEYSSASGNEVKTTLSTLILVRNQGMRQRHDIPVVRETGVLHAMIRSGDHEGWLMVQECLVLRPQKGRTDACKSHELAGPLASIGRRNPDSYRSAPVSQCYKNEKKLRERTKGTLTFGQPSFETHSRDDRCRLYVISKVSTDVNTALTHIPVMKEQPIMKRIFDRIEPSSLCVR